MGMLFNTYSEQVEDNLTIDRNALEDWIDDYKAEFFKETGLKEEDFSFDKRYTNSCEVLSHSGFDLHSLMINDTEQLCVCLLAIYVFLGKRRVFKYLAYLQI
jgi:hypothetical protein